jgi:o-succinylbenzoate---CoA ligase
MTIFEINPAKIDQIPEPETQYFRQALDFCKAWQSGQTKFVRHTSGSTGEPKPITLTRQQMQASANMTQQALGLQSNFNSLICLNINYIAGTMMLVRGLEVGMKMIIVEPSSHPLSDIPSDLKIDFAAFVPLQIQTMIETGFTDHLNSMKVVIVGGAAVSESLNTAIQDLKVPIYSTYGMTETVSHVALRLLNGPNRSAFYTLLDGILADTDERDCLKICNQVSNNQWVQTNDVVEWQGERVFKIIGRADNIINSGGVKIQLEKVEAAIEKTWKRAERFYCWWQPDERLGQALVLMVESQQPNFDLPTGLETHLTKYEIPKKIYTTPKFIETATGKIDKKSTFENLKKQPFVDFKFGQ